MTHNVSYDSENENSVCSFLIDDYNQALYQSVFCLVSFILPIFVIIFLYLLMLQRLWMGNRIPGRNISSESIRSKKKVTRMVSYLRVLYLLCITELPYF